MSRFRSIIRQSPAIVISLTALTLSLGGGVGYAASVAEGIDRGPGADMAGRCAGLHGPRSRVRRRATKAPVLAGS